MLSLLYDISPEISAQTAVFPGDTVFEQEVLFDCAKGDSFGLSWLKTTPHIGAHVDAPNHYSDSGVGISQRSLDYYFGPCQVIEVGLKPRERITPAHISQQDISQARILFKTNSFTDPNVWHNDFNALTPELVDVLAQKGVCLIGIDTPSVDLADDKTLHTHHQIYKHDMAILEGILLSEVPAGEYVLSALPLKMKNLDASPVRAVLLGEES